VTGWHLNELAPFDIESGGVDIENDGVVTVTVATVGGGKPTDVWSGLIAVDFDIDPKATEIHGITTEYARANGKPAADVLDEANERLAIALSAGRPAVGSNLPYDFSILDRNSRRYGVRTLEERLGGPIAPVIDVLTIDRHLDRYRPGKRKLENLCQHYGVRLDAAHDATEDALAAARVAYTIGARSHRSFDELCAIYADRRFPDRVAREWQAFAELTLGDLHTAQADWYREWVEGLGDYWAKESHRLRGVADRDEPPAVEGLPDATADERRVALRQQADELDQRAAGLTYDWPIVPFGGAA
jgi:DNA polymerase III subunit epsilon